MNDQLLQNMVANQAQAMEVASQWSFLSLLCMLPVFLISLAIFVFWVWMLIDCLTKESSEGNDKIIWALVILFLSGIGALVYYLVRRPVRIKELGE